MVRGLLKNYHNDGALNEKAPSYCLKLPIFMNFIPTSSDSVILPLSLKEFFLLPYLFTIFGDDAVYHGCVEEYRIVRETNPGYRGFYSDYPNSVMIIEPLNRVRSRGAFLYACTIFVQKKPLLEGKFNSPAQRAFA